MAMAVTAALAAWLASAATVLGQGAGPSSGSRSSARSTRLPATCSSGTCGTRAQAARCRPCARAGTAARAACRARSCCACADPARACRAHTRPAYASRARAHCARAHCARARCARPTPPALPCRPCRHLRHLAAPCLCGRRCQHRCPCRRRPARSYRRLRRRGSLSRCPVAPGRGRTSTRRGDALPRRGARRRLLRLVLGGRSDDSQDAGEGRAAPGARGLPSGRARLARA